MSKRRSASDHETETKKKTRESEVSDCEAGPSTSDHKDGKLWDKGLVHFVLFKIKQM